MADEKPRREELSPEEALRMMERGRAVNPRQQPAPVRAGSPTTLLITSHVVALSLGLAAGWFAAAGHVQQEQVFVPLRATAAPEAIERPATSTAPAHPAPAPAPAPPVRPASAPVALRPSGPRERPKPQTLPDPAPAPARPWWSALPASHSPIGIYRVETKEDRFDGHAIRTTPPLDLEAHGLLLHCFYIAKSERTPDALQLDAADPDAWSLRFSLHARNETWRYLKFHRVHLLADGKPVKLSGVQHDGDVGEGYVMEHITFDVPALELARLVDATVAEVRLGTDEARIKGDALGCLRQLAHELRKTVELASKGED